MQHVNTSKEIKYIVWLGTKKEPKMKKHNKILTELEADDLIKKLEAIFSDVKFTKERVNDAL